MVAARRCKAMISFRPPLSIVRIAAASALAAALLPAACAAELPSDARIVYDVLYGSGHFRIGRAEQHWHRNGDHYELTTDLLPVVGPHIRYVSTGHLGDAGLVPERFGEYRDGENAPRVRAEFDWAAHQLLFGRADEHKTAELTPGAQDVNALAYQLGWLGEHRMPASMQVATGKSVAMHTFNAGKPTHVSVGGKRVAVLPLADGNDDQRTEVWVAPQMANLPLRVVRIDDGRELQFVAQSVHYDDEAAADKAAKGDKGQ
jgi:hypothetical protein